MPTPTQQQLDTVIANLIAHTPSIIADQLGYPAPADKTIHFIEYIYALGKLAGATGAAESTATPQVNRDVALAQFEAAYPGLFDEEE